MSSKNVVREDVVQISFNVNDNPLDDLVKSMQDLQSSVTKLVNNITSKFSNVGNSAKDITDKIKDTGKEALTTSDKFHKMVDEIRKISTAKLLEMPKILNSSTTAAKNFISSLKSDIFSKLTDGFQKFKTSIQNISFSSLKSDVTSFGVKLKDVISISWSKFTSNLSSVGVAMKNVGNTITNLAVKVQSFVSKPYRVVLKASDEVSNVLNGISSKIINIKNALIGLVTTGLAAKAVGFVAEQQDLEAQYRILLGSAEAAEKTVKSLIDFAGKTPYAREEIFQANRQLLVFGGTALATDKTLRLVGDTASGTGQNFSDTAYRIGQLYSAMKSGHATGIYIKSLQQTGAITSEVANELEKLGDSGASFETKWAAVEKALSRYSGTMEEMSKNMSNLILGVKTFVKQKFIVPFGQGIVDSLQPALEEFKKWRTENAGTITQWGEKIRAVSSLITGKLIAGVKQLILYISRLKDAFVDFYHSDRGQTIINTLKTIFNTISSNKERLLKSFSSIAGVIGSLLIINKVKSSVLAFTKVFSGLSSVSKIVIGILGLLFYAFQNNIWGTRELVGKLSDLFIKLGEKVIPLLCSAFDFLISSVLPVFDSILSGIINFLNNNLYWIAPVIMGIVGAFLALKAAILIVNAVLIIQKGVIIAVKAIMIVWKVVTLAVQAAQWLLNIALMANPIILIITLIVALIAVFIWLWFNCEDFRNFWINLWETVCAWCKIAWDWIVNLFAKWIPEAFASVINFFVELWENIKSIFWNTINAIVSFFTETIPQFIQNICDWFAQLPYRIGFLIGQLIGHIVKFGMDLWNFATVTVPEFIGQVINFFAELPGKIWECLCVTTTQIAQFFADLIVTGITKTSEFVSSVINFIKELPGKIWEWLCETAIKVIQFFANLIVTGIAKASEFVSSIINFIKELPSKIWNAIIGAIKRVIEWGGNLLSAGIEAARNLINGIWNTLCELPNKMLEIGKNIVTGIWNGICGAVGWLMNMIKDFAKGILDGIKSSLGIHSPSILFRDEVGRNLALGLGEGFVSTMDNVKNEMQKALPTSFGTRLNMYVNKDNKQGINTNNNNISNYLFGYGLSEYTPDSSYTTSNKTNYESNTYSPQFNLTVNGSVTDRTTQRQIKQFMKEAMEEAFESMQRKRPDLVEV